MKQQEIFDDDEVDNNEDKLSDTPIGTQISQYGIWLGEEPGIYDVRNELNDLTGKEWLKRTKSVWMSERCAEDKAAFNHPAPFLIRDIRKLITMFTKKGMLVLDPFVGSGTTLIAAAIEKRDGIGIDINPDYLELAVSRLEDYLSNEESMLFNLKEKERKIENHIPDIKLDSKLIEERKQFWIDWEKKKDHIVLQPKNDCHQALIEGNSKLLIGELPKIDYCVTSPPYHNILRNKGNGVRHDGSQTRQGVEYYSENPEDLGNQESYQDYLDCLGDIFIEIYRKLRNNKYCTIIISDFTVDKQETNAHGDVIDIMRHIGFTFMGTIVLVQDSKPLYPFGYPYQFRINHVHQYILNFLKRE